MATSYVSILSMDRRILSETDGLSSQQIDTPETQITSAF
jgi:hypothetical protein